VREANFKLIKRTRLFAIYQETAKTLRSCDIINRVGEIVIVTSRLLKRYLKAKCTRAPAYSQALHQIRGVVRGKLRSGYRNRNHRIYQRCCPEDSPW